MIKMMKEFLSVSSKQAEQQTSLLQNMASSRMEGSKNREERKKSEIQQAQQLALEAGVDEECGVLCRFPYLQGGRT